MPGAICSFPGYPPADPIGDRLRAQAPRMAGVAGGRLGAVRFSSRLTTHAPATPGAVFWVPDWALQQNCSLLDYLGDISTSVPEWDRQFRLARIHHEHRKKLGRLRLAGIGADAVAVTG